MCRIAGVVLFSFFYVVVNAQKDSLQTKQLEEVVITATRTEKKLGFSAVPTQVINSKTIQQTGAVRLNDVLVEQTGINVTQTATRGSTGGSVFGTGIQMQGFAADYILILIDGEPVIGRQGGVLDLTRVAVENIKRIEIVKGPTSSLYGSEALGGVVNIITHPIQSNKVEASFRYGRFSTTDVNLTAAIKKQHWGIHFFSNRNSSSGFDLDKENLGNSVDPFHRTTNKLKICYQPVEKTKITFGGTCFYEQQKNYFQTQRLNNTEAVTIVGVGKVNDVSGNIVLEQQVSPKIKSTFKFYHSQYEYKQRLAEEKNNSPFYYDFFQQNFSKAENQLDLQVQKNNLISVGGGVIAEKLNTTRYDGEKSNAIQYVFFQDEWKYREKLIVIGGLRFDRHSLYQSTWSPKLAAQYAATKKFRLNASIGAGFKAPDFRQLFLNFLNTAAGGYIVYGANEVTFNELLLQKQQGIIAEILPRAQQLTNLKPENSIGWNLGGQMDISSNTKLSFNFFRNDIENLIQVETIAFRNNAAPVYSYFNVRKAFTQGLELNGMLQLHEEFQIVGGYQFLMTADKATLKQIKEGVIFTRDILSNESFQVNRKDYAGLPNRSAHSWNVKLFYHNKQRDLDAAIRILYQSRWGTFDKDGNGIINRADEFAKGFALVNFTVTKTVNPFRFQTGVNNLLNYKDKQNLPGQPGIQPYLSISYSFINTKNKE